MKCIPGTVYVFFFFLQYVPYTLTIRHFLCISFRVVSAYVVYVTILPDMFLLPLGYFFSADSAVRAPAESYLGKKKTP